MCKDLFKGSWYSVFEFVFEKIFETDVIKKSYKKEEKLFLAIFF